MNFVAKEDISKFPLIDFNGNIFLIEKEQDVINSCNIIEKADVVGFDTETKPAFQKGVFHDISLIQISVNNNVFLFRINKVGFDKRIINILSNSKILKIGIDIKNDITGLKKIQPFNDSNFLDLNELALSKGFKSIGAVKLSIMLLGSRISKKQRLTDWSADILTRSQLKYAAIDAWICPKIFSAFKAKMLYP
tara:strand:- start:9620 stop:10198 length:579 start_codon:yes stop_codon:yes gene_type:complete